MWPFSRDNNWEPELSDDHYVVQPLSFEPSMEESWAFETASQQS